MLDRSTRERMAADERNVYTEWHKLRHRYAHIFAAPNSQRFSETFDTLLAKEVPGKRLLEIGCGSGKLAQKLASYGAASVLGTDISHTRIATAQEQNTSSTCTFAIADVSLPIEGVFDVIIGSAILHHLDYQEVLLRIYHDNLTSGGIMLFCEPLGGNLLMKLFRILSAHAHTEDERAFAPRDLAWIGHTFEDFTIIPTNYFTLPLGVVSGLLFKSPNNWLLRLADRLDVWVAQHVVWLHSHFRYAMFIIRKR
jgi:SAM-dependent methyltransferase